MARLPSRPKALIVLLDGQVAGELHQDPNGRLSFRYGDDYRRLPDPTPLSLSMRPTRQEHKHGVVNPFLCGLLPDDQAVLDRWAERFHVSANNPFGLLTHVGEDVAGAAQFVLPSRVEESIAGGSLQSIGEDYIAKRLAILRADRAAWSDPDSPGQFSLAGAQSKFALYQDPHGGGWFVPTGRYPTTHILKPALPNLNDQDINEHLCLVAAGNLGLTVARSEIAHFGPERAVVLARYDRRVNDDGAVERIHQEDFCQALGIMPADKYERGDYGRPGRGPGVARMVGLIREVQGALAAEASTWHYFRSLAFNWLICGPDAHAKNYSILLAGYDALASPLYDISSVLPYPRTGGPNGAGFELRRMAMAMSVNGQFENGLVTGQDWAALASKLRLDPDTALQEVDAMADRVADAFADAARANGVAIGPNNRMVGALVDGVATYSATLRAHLGVG